MLPKKLRHLLYAFLLLLFSALGTTAIAKNKVHAFFTEVASELNEAVSNRNKEAAEMAPETTQGPVNKSNVASTTAAAMFATIIQGADEEVGCSVNGFTVSRFNLCGDSDNRSISLSGSYGSVSWQRLGGSCSPDINTDCPNTTVGCYTEVATGEPFNLDASTIPSGSGAEFRVVADGQQYFFKVKKSSITQSFVKSDNICGVPGRIQITGLSSAYEFSINSGSGFGPWQGPIFNNLGPDTYIVKARLRNTPNTCEYPYAPITIEQRAIDIEVSFTDANCSGDTGTITVTAGNVPGPYKYTLLDETGTAQEFTAFIPDNPYTFSAVGFGTYTVQVETAQCAGDPANGIDPPRQDRDTSNNPIIIGAGVSALSASAEPNNSFSAACGISSVDITVYTSGGTPPYSYIVNGSGPSSPSYSTSRVETVTNPGTYDFLITDANGCTITASANVAELTPPDITVAGVDGTCTNGGARLEFTVVDAKGYDLGFRAQPGDPWSNNPVLSVAAGSYSPIQVQYTSGAFSCIMDIDADNNGTADSVSVTEVGTVTGTAVKNSDVSCNLGGGTTGGEIEFNGPFTGGSGTGYQFSIDGVTFSTALVYSGLPAGTYSPVIIDDSGCRRDLTAITINGVTPPTNLDFAQSNTNCGLGTSDLQLTPTSTHPITTYEIVNPTTASNATGLFTGLSNGTTYTFRITDDQNCSYTETFTPITISSIRARVKSGGDLRVCTGATDGTGTYLIDGFGSNYTYNINGGPESAPQNDAEVDLPLSGAGTYTINVTDADTGCTDTASFDIEAPTAPIDLTANVTDMSCANGNRGRVIGNTTGGWGGYRYTLQPPTGAPIGPRSSRTFNNLTQTGTYILSVEDAEGCTDTYTFNLSPIDAPSIALDAPASDYCYVPGTGATIGVTSTAGSAPLSSHQYRINGGPLQGSPIFIGLTPGNYTIEVVDGNTCRAQISTTVAPQFRVNTSVVTEIPCGGTDGRLNVNVSGGYGMVQYEVSLDGGAFGAAIPQTASSFNFDTNVPGEYVFRVTDNEGCTADSSPITLNPPISIAPAAWTPVPVSCGGTDNGRVTITPDGTSGVPPYEINFDGRGWSTQTVFSNLAAGSYPFLVRDARGCETVLDNAVVGTDNTPSPDATVSEIIATCSAGGVSGGIRIDNVINGTENFSFRIADNTGTIVAQQDDVARASLPIDMTDSALVPGTYTIITLDANGCRDIEIVEITQADLTVVPVPMPTPACNVAGFSETVDIVGGTGPFLIRLENDPLAPVSPNSPPRRHTFNGLQFGVTYTVEVTDTATGCTYLDEIPPIYGPSPLAVTATSTPGACDITNRNGEITYEVTGFTVGTDNLRIEILDNGDGSTTLIETVAPIADPYTNTYGALAGDYQIIVTNLTDNCSNATGVIIDENLPAIDILAEEPANCNAEGQITVQGRGGDGGPYEFFFQPQGDPEPTAGNPAWTTETTFVALAGNYEIYVRDGSGCTSFDIGTVIQLDPDLDPPTIEVTNQCIVTATSFDVRVWVPLSVDTPRFTLAGDTQFGTDIGNGVYEYTYQVSSPGTYTVDLIDANGCNGQGTAEVYEFLSASGDFSTMPTCNAADGTIAMNVVGGSDDFTYQLQDGVGTDIGSPITGDRNAGVIAGVAPGTYQVEVVDNETGCNFIVAVQLDAATPPVIQSEIKQDITCFGSNDGSIDIVLVPASAVDAPIEYILNNLTSGTEYTRNNTGSFTGLPPAQYQVEVLTARNCSALSSPIDIIEPSDFAITAIAPDFTCEPAANRFSSTVITVNVDPSNPGTVGSGYQYSIEGFFNYQSANTFEIVDDGSPRNITVYAMDGNGCQTTFDLPTINPPMDVVPTFTVIDALNCANPERIEISVTGTTDFTVITTGPGSTTVSDVSVTGGSTATVLLPDAGDYFFVVRDDSPSGCDYPLPVHTVNLPVEPTVTITEANPVRCAVPGGDGGLFIEVSDYSGTYDYRVFEASDTGKTTVINSGSFDTNNFPDVSGDPARITGLPGGSYFVEVVATGVPFCTSDSGVATIRVPNGALDVVAVEVGNVTCDDNLGNISATGSGGWDTTPYEYRLLWDDGSGFVEIVPFGTTKVFNNLSSGDYQVEIRDVEGCTDTFDINLPPIPAISAGIREPQNLVCPGGNNAVLEAFNMSTGNPGAEGGVSGAGYKYQLIYLDSDMTGMPTPSGLDERERSGLQDDPTFIGTSGGVISAGWYAIEVTSSYNCSFVTPPYEVIPPPPVRPRLVQTQVPGCGGRGEMELTIENPDPDPSVVYEYVLVENGSQIGIYADMGGTSFRFPGDAGITYQVDVRKKNVSNVCTAVRSNGITMTDASGITLLPNTPDDISCASELDGRIESFINGGVGNAMFTLYIGDPVDAFSPVATATVFRGPQDFGTFEGLPEGAQYYIGVTSGATCQDIAGPFEIERPEPIVFTSTETPVSCAGEADGTLTLEVINGGVGLIQFAIAPNFNEFFSDASTPGQYTFEDLAAGDYEILIQDENGCFEKDVLTVTEPDELTVTDVVTTPETCIGAADGTAQLTISGGTPFIDPVTSAEYYETKLVGPDSDGSEMFVRNDGLYFENLEGGVSYIVFIQDANLCGALAQIPIEIGVDLTAEPIVEYGCEGIFPNSTTRIALQDESRLSEILFALDPNNPTDAITAMATDQLSWGDLPAGDHTVYIYHENGCTNSVDFTIEAYEPLMLNAQKTGPNEITAVAAGGFGGYEYFFNGESYGSEGIYTTTESGMVEVRVVDQNGCVMAVSIPFEFTGMLEIPNFFSPNGDNENDFWSPRNREFFPDIEVIIYDRYGRVVAELDQVSEWDGLYDNKELPTGDYWYVVNQNDKRETRYVGHFTLYR